jgi:hypothetical protein
MNSITRTRPESSFFSYNDTPSKYIQEYRERERELIRICFVLYYYSPPCMHIREHRKKQEAVATNKYTSRPSVDEVLDPLEALAEGALDAALRGVRLVRRHPPLPVRVRVAAQYQSPPPLLRRRRRRRLASAAAELVLVRRRHGTATSAGAARVGPDAVRPRPSTNAAAAVVGLDLHAAGARVRLGPVHGGKS